MRSSLRGGEGFLEGDRKRSGVQDGKRGEWGAVAKAKAEMIQQSC